MNIKQLGLLFGLMGVVTSTYAAEGREKDKSHNDKSQMQDCKSLCFAGPHLEDDYCVEVMAAAIYEQVAVQSATIAVGTNSTTNELWLIGGKGVEPTETTSWGFKVGAAWKTCHDDWKFGARYTWLKATTTSTNIPIPNSGGGVFPTQNATQLLTNLSGAIFSFQDLQSGNYTQLNTLNIYLMRPTLQTALLEVSPYFGIDVAVTRRRQTSVFTNDNTAPFPQRYINGGYYEVWDNNSFWGVGPMIGLETNWYVGYGIGIYADGYGALTFGQAKSYSQNFSKIPTATTPDNSAQVSHSMYQFSPEVNMQLGLSWSDNFNEDRGAITLRLGYEAAYYFQANKTLINSTSSYGVTNGSGIGTQGLVLACQFDF